MKDKNLLLAGLATCSVVSTSCFTFEATLSALPTNSVRFSPEQQASAIRAVENTASELGFSRAREFEDHGNEYRHREGYPYRVVLFMLSSPSSQFTLLAALRWDDGEIQVRLQDIDHGSATVELERVLGTGFGTAGDAVADLLATAAVHPMREGAARALLAKAGAEESVLDGLVANERLRRVFYRGQTFYVRRLVRGTARIAPS